MKKNIFTISICSMLFIVIGTQAQTAINVPNYNFLSYTEEEGNKILSDWTMEVNPSAAYQLKWKDDSESSPQLWAVNFWAEEEYTANIYQEISGLENGSYRFYVTANCGGGGSFVVFANDVEVAIPETPSTVAWDGDQWVETGVDAVVTDGKIKIGFGTGYVSTLGTYPGEWINVCSTRLDYMGASSVGSVKEDAAVINAEGGMLSVSGGGNVFVYTVDGRLIANGNNELVLPVGKGVYLVKANNVTHKIIAK